MTIANEIQILFDDSTSDSIRERIVAKYGDLRIFELYEMYIDEQIENILMRRFNNEV